MCTSHTYTQAHICICEPRRMDANQPPSRLDLNACLISFSCSGLSAVSVAMVASAAKGLLTKMCSTNVSVDDNVGLGLTPLNSRRKQQSSGQRCSQLVATDQTNLMCPSWLTGSRLRHTVWKDLDLPLSDVPGDIGFRPCWGWGGLVGFALGRWLGHLRSCSLILLLALATCQCKFPDRMGPMSVSTTRPICIAAALLIL